MIGSTAYNVIYLLRNKRNNKVYVGQTWTPLCERAGHKGVRYVHCKYLYNAIKKYGWEQFYYEFLTICGTQETADYWEQYFVIKYKSNNKKHGYNIKSGGMAGKHTPETRRKMSASQKGKQFTAETRQKLSIASKGKKMSDEAKQKMSIAKKNRTWKLIDGKRVWI